MKVDVIVGLAVIAGSLSAIIFLTLWCRRIIENLHSKRLSNHKREVRKLAMKEANIRQSEIAVGLSRELKLFHITILHRKRPILRASKKQ